MKNTSTQPECEVDWTELCVSPLLSSEGKTLRYPKCWQFRRAFATLKDMCDKCHLQYCHTAQSKLRKCHQVFSWSSIHSWELQKDRKYFLEIESTTCSNKRKTSSTFVSSKNWSQLMEGDNSGTATVWFQRTTLHFLWRGWGGGRCWREKGAWSTTLVHPPSLLAEACAKCIQHPTRDHAGQDCPWLRFLAKIWWQRYNPPKSIKHGWN